MKKADVKVGAIVGGKSEEELKKPFLGKVEKIYENSVLLAITSYDPEDESSVNELNNKMVINFKSLKKRGLSSVPIWNGKTSRRRSAAITAA